MKTLIAALFLFLLVGQSDKSTIEVEPNNLPQTASYGGILYYNTSSPISIFGEIESNKDEYAGFNICMVKTHLSLSHDPELKGRPKGWTLPINDFMVYKGAGFIVPVAGGIKLMPGTASNPGFRHIDVNVETGKVTGLF